MTGERKTISVIIPALNEVRNLAPAVEQLLAALEGAVDNFEIIIVDDGSTDGTGAVAENLAHTIPQVRALHNARNMGLGYSYARGYRTATMDYLVYVPGDNTWPTPSLMQLFRHLGEADVVTSYATNPQVRPLGRRWVSSAYTAALNLLFSRHLAYFNGLTIYPVAFLRTEPATTLGFGFQAEVLLKALAAGLSYVEVALLIDERAAGKSKAVNVRNILSVAATVMRLLYELRIRRRADAIDAPRPIA
jgi:dolichol-phosphate mannosyltransferase